MIALHDVLVGEPCSAICVKRDPEHAKRDPKAAKRSPEKDADKQKGAVVRKGSFSLFFLASKVT